jgi:hypothetical protein
MAAKRQSKSDSEPFQLSLRIRHPSMDPDDISSALKIKPEHSFRAGTPRPSSHGGATASVYAESYWLGVLKPVGQLAEMAFPADRESQIAQKQLAVVRNSLSWALSLSTSRLLKLHADLLRRVRTEGGDVSLLVTLHSGEVSSFTLAPGASQVFGDLGIAVEFEFAGE